MTFEISLPPFASDTTIVIGQKGGREGERERERERERESEILVQIRFESGLKFTCSENGSRCVFYV